VVVERIPLGPRDVRVVEVVRQLPLEPQVLIVAVGAEALVALGGVAAAQRVLVDRGGGGRCSVVGRWHRSWLPSASAGGTTVT